MNKKLSCLIGMVTAVAVGVGVFVPLGLYLNSKSKNKRINQNQILSTDSRKSIDDSLRLQIESPASFVVNNVEKNRSEKCIKINSLIAAMAKKYETNIVDFGQVCYNHYVLASDKDKFFNDKFEFIDNLIINSHDQDEAFIAHFYLFALAVNLGQYFKEKFPVLNNNQRGSFFENLRKFEIIRKLSLNCLEKLAQFNDDFSVFAEGIRIVKKIDCSNGIVPKDTSKQFFLETKRVMDQLKCFDFELEFCPFYSILEKKICNNREESGIWNTQSFFNNSLYVIKDGLLNLYLQKNNYKLMDNTISNNADSSDKLGRKLPLMENNFACWLNCIAIMCYYDLNVKENIKNIPDFVKAKSNELDEFSVNFLNALYGLVNLLEENCKKGNFYFDPRNFLLKNNIDLPAGGNCLYVDDLIANLQKFKTGQDNGFDLFSNFMLFSDYNSFYTTAENEINFFDFFENPELTLKKLAQNRNENFKDTNYFLITVNDIGNKGINCLPEKIGEFELSCFTRVEKPYDYTAYLRKDDYYIRWNCLRGEVKAISRAEAFLNKNNDDGIIQGDASNYISGILNNNKERFSGALFLYSKRKN